MVKKPLLRLLKLLHRLLLPLLLLMLLLPLRLLPKLLLPPQSKQNKSNKKADASRLFYYPNSRSSGDLAPAHPFMLRRHANPISATSQYSAQCPHCQFGQVVLAAQVRRHDML